jgi:hypothetical protein
MEALRTCCLNADSLGEMRAREQSLLVASLTRVARKVVAKLYDPKAKHKSCHTNLNKLRVRLATSKDCSLARISPSESAFKQHVLRASIQTKMWMTSHQAKPAVASPYDYGWQKGSNGPTQFCSLV